MTRGRPILIALLTLWAFGAGPVGQVSGQYAMPPSEPTENIDPWSEGPVRVPRRVMPRFGPPSPYEYRPMEGDGSSWPLFGVESWSWQFLPEGLLYKAYLAGGKEPRLATDFVHQRSGEWTWDSTIGLHVGLLRYGTQGALWPEGWQVDAEAAAFPRIRLDDDHTMVSTDFRFGVPLTWRQGPLESKFGCYHECSHLGDEYLVEHQTLERLNYTRDALVWGFAVRPVSMARLYAEADWAFAMDGGSKPWHFQFGLDLSPAEPNRGLPYPFLAINTRLRQEVDYSGSLVVQTGLQWRTEAGRLLRAGLQYFNGLSDQYQFFRRFEEQIGFGVWYDY